MLISNIQYTKKFAVVLLLISQAAFAQTVVVSKAEQRLKGMTMYGYSTTLDASGDEVNTSLTRYLKTYGKPRQQDTYLLVPTTNLNGQVFEKPLYSILKNSGNGTQVWLGISLEEWTTDSSKVTSQLEQMVKTFGVNFYRDKIQAQIDEAQQAVDAVDKQQQRTLNENRTITNRIENNKSEHQNLKLQIQRNRADSVSLQLRMSQNQRTTDSLKMVSEKVKKALEFQRERQRRVN